MAVKKYRKHSPEFKLRLVQDIRSGTLGRREAARKFEISQRLIQWWLERYDAGELESDETLASLAAEYEDKIAALERMVGQLTMTVDALTRALEAATDQK